MIELRKISYGTQKTFGFVAKIVVQTQLFYQTAVVGSATTLVGLQFIVKIVRYVGIAKQRNKK